MKRPDRAMRLAECLIDAAERDPLPALAHRIAPESIGPFEVHVLPAHLLPNGDEEVGVAATLQLGEEPELHRAREFEIGRNREPESRSSRPCLEAGLTGVRRRRLAQHPWP